MEMVVNVKVEVFVLVYMLAMLSTFLPLVLMNENLGLSSFTLLGGNGMLHQTQAYLLLK